MCGKIEQMIDLYTFQSDLKSAVSAALRRNKSVLMQSSPGSGKTVIASHMVDAAIHATPPIRTWFVCHRSELIFQTEKTFRKQGLDFGHIAAGYPVDQKNMLQICSIDTLKNRLNDVLPPGMIIWDECHHLQAKGWLAVKDHYPDIYHIGMSGTPHRLDGKGLYPSFKEMVLGPTSQWLIENKFLADYRFFNPTQPDLSGVDKIAGDYNQGGANVIMSNPTITGSVLAHYKKYCLGKRAILFATSIERSKAYAEEFKAAGISALHLDGTTDKGIRKAVAYAFASGDIDVLCNVNLFGEGYDLSAQAGMDCPVQVVLDCKPSMSLSLVLQMWFRALRMQDDPAMIFDFSGNYRQHGLPDDDREWSLEGDKDQGKKPGEADILNRTCPKCFSVRRFGGNECKECGHVFEVQSRKIDEVEGDLKEIDKEAIRAAQKQQVTEARTLDQLVALGEERNYKSPERWAGYVYTARKAAAKKHREVYAR